MTDTSKPFKIKNSCYFVINSMRDSCLNYCLQETPFSLYLTIGETFARSSSAADKDSFSILQISDHHQRNTEVVKLELPTFMKLLAKTKLFIGRIKKPTARLIQN